MPSFTRRRPTSQSHSWRYARTYYARAAVVSSRRGFTGTTHLPGVGETTIYMRHPWTIRLEHNLSVDMSYRFLRVGSTTWEIWRDVYIVYIAVIDKMLITTVYLPNFMVRTTYVKIIRLLGKKIFFCLIYYRVIIFSTIVIMLFSKCSGHIPLWHIINYDPFGHN